jgi:four helix bundle protein
LRHRSQAEDAIDSVCRNIAEGFACASHGEFDRYMAIARRSLNEMGDSLRSAGLRDMCRPKEASEIHAITRRLYPALVNFIAYLQRTPDWTRQAPPDTGGR